VTDTCDIAIIGGGAAGLAAAIFAAEAGRAAGQPLHIVLLDGAKSLGAKILVSGGARCNVTNERVTAKDYNAPGGAAFVRHVLSAFDEKDAVKWFDSLGVELKREEAGKLFPVTDSSRTVLEALLRRCEQLKIDIRTKNRVSEVRLDSPDSPQARQPAPDTRFFFIAHNKGDLRASRLIMATGGKSLPLTGSDGGGWRIAQSLGHAVTPTFPALAPLVLESSFFNAAISGLALEVELSTFTAGKLIDRRAGSLLWTHFGVSGPVVMDASRHWVMANASGAATELKCSLLPGRDFAAAEKWLIDLASRQPRRSLVTALSELLPSRMCEALLQHILLDGGTSLGQLAREERRKLVHALTALPLPVLRDRGWNYAEVTAGGVPLAEVHHRDMQSRIVPGLYLIGEMLDCDGRIGGFNFQWAWSTGFIAGSAAAR
jgi:predicted Rossmann fold flavoprotein